MITTKEDLKNLSNEVIDTIGPLAMIIAMEECSELQKAISKLLRGKGDTDNLAEEIADVIISIEFLKSKYQISDETITKWLNVKSERIKHKLENKEFY